MERKMESLTKLCFLDFKDASPEVLAVLERIQDPEHSKVELPLDGEPPPQVYGTCRLPPDGTEYAAEEPPAAGAAAGGGAPLGSGAAGELPGLLAGVPHVPQTVLPPHLVPAAAPQMYQQAPAGYPYGSLFVNGMPGMVPYGMPPGYQLSHGYQPEPPPPPPPAADDRRRGKRGEKGAQAHAQYPSYPMSPRAAAGSPLVMAGFPGNPYPPFYHMPYASYYYPGAEMMMAMPPMQQMQGQMQQPPMQMQAPSQPAPVPADGAVPIPVQPEPAVSCAPADPGTPPVAVSAEEEEEESAAAPADPPAAAAGPTATAAALAPAASARLSFGFDLDDKLAGGESSAVQLLEAERPPARAEPPDDALDGRAASAEPAEAATYVATVTVRQSRVMPPPADAPLIGEEEEEGEDVPAAEETAAAELEAEPEPEPEPPQEQPEDANGTDGTAEQPEPAPADPPAPAPAPAPRSWASLFQTRKADAVPAPAAAPPPKPVPPPPQPDTNSELLGLGAALSQFEICHKNAYLQPRGLTNKSNWCYINATLQALASCTPFYHLMKSLPSNIGLQSAKSRTPIIDAMVEFMNEFSPLPELPRLARRRERERAQLRDLALGPAFEPSYVYAMLARVSTDAFRVAGRQEDAEEFLTCLLSGLQDEMSEVLKVYRKTQEDAEPVSNGATNGDTDHRSDESEGDSDDWQTIVGKNKGQVTRSAELQATPISRIFSGQLRSSLHRQGAKPTATVQSFFSLQLDIQSASVSSVEQALESLVARDPVVGLTCPQSGQPVEAWQQAALELTPPTLILHLKRFLYDPATDGVQKLLKRITFPVELELKRELLSSARSKLGPGLKRYRLFAIVYHSGRESTKGHYVTDAYHPAYQQWVRYDDSTVTAVAEAAVLKPEPPLVPYILFYRRLDTVANGK